jgi:membrane-bound metal-dependent hydrolase YbcI (DUF457 family)
MGSMLGKALRSDAIRRPSAPLILIALLLLLIGDHLERSIGGEGVRAGLADELAHLMTGYIILAVAFRGASPKFAAGVLIGSVAIDADHIPQYLHHYFLTEGTQRPYTHSLLTVGVLLVIAGVGPKHWRPFVLGLVVGTIFHFARDLCESNSGVPLLWPWSYYSYRGSHTVYLIVMGILAWLACVRAIIDGRRSRAPGPDLISRRVDPAPD